MKNKTFIQSIKCSINGMKYAVKTEKNYRYYLGLLAGAVIVNTFLGISLAQNLLILFVFVGACSAESLNTAIEHLVDRENKQYDEEVGIIKDVAASALLGWGILYLIMEGYILCSHFF